MAWNELHLIAQRQESVADGGEQLLVVAAWEVSAANGTGKEHITHKGQPCLD